MTQKGSETSESCHINGQKDQNHVTVTAKKASETCHSKDQKGIRIMSR